MALVQQSGRNQRTKREGQSTAITTMQASIVILRTLWQIFGRRRTRRSGRLLIVLLYDDEWRIEK